MSSIVIASRGSHSGLPPDDAPAQPITTERGRSRAHWSRGTVRRRLGSIVSSVYERRRIARRRRAVDTDDDDVVEDLYVQLMEQSRRRDAPAFFFCRRSSLRDQLPLPHYRSCYSDHTRTRSHTQATDTV